MVILTLRYFAGPEVPRYVLFTVGYTWFCSLSIIILVPADIYTKWKYVLGVAMACSNTFGLVTGAFLLGFGLSEIPKSLWRNADWTTRQKVLSHKIAKMAVKLDDAHQELSNAIVVSCSGKSNQMSKRDPLRPYMNVIDNMLAQMFREDPAFKPQGGRLGENDMDYDTDEKSMATLRRHLRGAREGEYMTYVLEALELEDTIKNYEHGSSTGWKYISSFRPAQTGKLGAFFDTMEYVWRCILRKQFEKLLAIILGTMSAAILLAESTLLPSNVNLSLFSILINSIGKQELFVQDKTAVEMKATTSLVTDATKGSTSTPLKEEGSRYSTSKEAISNKYASLREQSRHANARPAEKNIASATVSLLDSGNSESSNTRGPSGLASKWESMKNGFQSFKANIGPNDFFLYAKFRTPNFSLMIHHPNHLMRYSRG
ncbi:hypothetical protein GH714_017485 [Hevea brasiliensis]|uniref:Uncharacterized protein n=1 Tax=Hevea brasiliensis TaxID=3981 RepID=A0A6A6K6A4_HEVBR|nr:hypothetical protein GH714_017485 [Hevea brasiliensis]